MLPNFLVVGAAKSGTSSLDRYLAQHPEVYMPQKKEAHIFSIPDFPTRFQGPGDEGMNTETIRSMDRYQALFADAQPYRAVGESSVFYLHFPGTAQRIQAANPDMKILMLLRNPVDRAFSAYMHVVRDERETLSFEDSMRQEPVRKQLNYEPMWLYRELGLYTAQVKRFLEVFPRKQVKILLFEEFSRNTEASMADIFRFLDVDPSVRIDTGLRHNESGLPKSRGLFNFIAKPHPIKEVFKPLVPQRLRERIGIQAKSMLLQKVNMNPTTRRELEGFFADDIRALADLIDQDLRPWFPKQSS